MLNDFDFLQGYFSYLVSTNQVEFEDQVEFKLLAIKGIAAIESNDVKKLRQVVIAMTRLTQSSTDEIPEDLANIIKG